MCIQPIKISSQGGRHSTEVAFALLTQPYRVRIFLPLANNQAQKLFQTSKNCLVPLHSKKELRKKLSPRDKWFPQPNITLLLIAVWINSLKEFSVFLRDLNPIPQDLLSDLNHLSSILHHRLDKINIFKPFVWRNIQKVWKWKPEKVSMRECVSERERECVCGCGRERETFYWQSKPKIVT